MTRKEKRFWKGAGLVSAEMIATLVVFTTVLSGVIFLIRPRVRRYKKVDLKIFDLVKPHITERNNRLMLFFTLLGKHQFLIPANLSLIFYFLFIHKRTWFSIRVVSIALSSLLLMFALKHLFKRKRPTDPLLRPAKGLSFPSGHAIMSVTFFGLIIYIVSHEVRSQFLRTLIIAQLILLMQVIGFSRVYLRVHYASDVVVGHVTGLMWLLISLGVLERVEEYNKGKIGRQIIHDPILSKLASTAD